MVLITASAADAASITLQWDAPTDGLTIGYVVSYRTASGDFTSRLIIGATTRQEVTGLADGLEYCFTVQALNLFGLKSASSEQVCGTAGIAVPSDYVTNATELQAALNAARAGDTIFLQAGVTFVGNFVLPRRAEGETGYVTIRSSAADTSLPADGVRITPASAAYLPKLRSPNSSPVISTEPGAHHYRLQFLEVLANAGGGGAMIALGSGTEDQDSLNDIPHELVLDRLYVHGDATSGQPRGIALNSASTDILNSYVSEIKWAGAPAQAIAAWNGPGPYRIENNYLESAGQNVVVGLQEPSIPQLIPADITVRRNHLSKKLAWRSQPWPTSALLELKNAQDVVIDGNQLENAWAEVSAGFAVLIHSVNSFSATPWSSVSNVTFTNNVVRNVASGVYLFGPSLLGTDTVKKVTLRNNLFERVTTALAGAGMFLMVLGTADIVVDHNTVFSDGNSAVFSSLPAKRFVFTNNILFDRGALLGSGVVAGRKTIAGFFSDGDFRGGIFVGSNAKQYPIDNYYPTSEAALRMVNRAAGDYRLSKLSIYRGGGTDGKDPGCDFDELAAAQQ